MKMALKCSFGEGGSVETVRVDPEAMMRQRWNRRKKSFQ